MDDAKKHKRNLTKAKKTQDLRKRTNDAKHNIKKQNSLFTTHDNNCWVGSKKLCCIFGCRRLQTYIIQTLHEPKNKKHISKTHISLCICNSDLPFNMLGFPHLQE